MNKDNIKVLRNAIFVLTISISFLFLLEFFSRLIFNYDFTILKIMKDSGNPTLLYELKPKAQIVFRGLNRRLPPTTIKISSQGIRDYEYFLAKPDDVFRIIILGDSIGMGWGVELENTAAKQLERLLNLDSKNKYQVINFSIDGYNFVQEVELLEKKCIIYSPDLVIFISCYNDYVPCLIPSRGFSNPLLKSHLIASLFVYRCLNIAKENAFFQEGVSKIRDSFNRLDGITRDYNFKVIFYKTPDWLKNVIKEHSFEENIVPVNADLGNHVIDNIDGHPDSYGHLIMAQDIYGYLKHHHVIK